MDWFNTSTLLSLFDLLQRQQLQNRLVKPDAAPMAATDPKRTQGTNLNQQNSPMASANIGYGPNGFQGGINANIDLRSFLSQLGVGLGA